MGVGQLAGRRRSIVTRNGSQNIYSKVGGWNGEAGKEERSEKEKGINVWEKKS